MNRTTTAMACLLLCGGALGFLEKPGRPPAAPEQVSPQARSDLRTPARRVPSPPGVAAEPRAEEGFGVPVQRTGVQARAPHPPGPTPRVALDRSVTGGTAAAASVDGSHFASVSTQHPSVSDPVPAPGDSDTDAPAEGISAPPSINVPFSPVNGTAAATIPAALVEIDSDTPLTQAEREGIAQLAEAFVAKTEGGSQDPHNPVRQQRWAKAQEESDIQMRARYGGHAWLIRHRDAYRKALGNSPVPPGREK